VKNEKIPPKENWKPTCGELLSRWSKKKKNADLFAGFLRVPPRRVG
jgi:hypothetical protein